MLLRMLTRLGFIALLLFIGLGSDFDRGAVHAAHTESNLSALKTAIVRQVGLQQTEIDMAYSGDRKQLSAKIGELLQEVFASDEYIAYIVDSYLYTIRTWGPTVKIKLTVTYRESAEQTKLVNRRVEQLLPSIVSSSMTDTQKVRAIHDWIVSHVSFDTTFQRYTAFEALNAGKAVCQGYSLLAYKMLASAGIEARIIEGKVESGSHVWNLVHLGSHWYHMDVTWDDPLPDRPGMVSENYFLKSDAEIRKDHTWTKSYPSAG
ncbi:transglutaminase domain-containing protein [Paenibacillus sp. R14(2021)]|uniref:transglutaminase domain-containing protein n=1 Tax=Paenibacillus sp. R14(2021) TaxID=2859228 RepID=UPI001C612698|nr:transglutaminase domain-containing protein [Paenibacillus sp. R14(2021)]